MCGAAHRRVYLVKSLHASQFRNSSALCAKAAGGPAIVSFPFLSLLPSLESLLMPTYALETWQTKPMCHIPAALNTISRKTISRMTICPQHCQLVGTSLQIRSSYKQIAELDPSHAQKLTLYPLHFKYMTFSTS